jgi:hypothetical protein
MAIHNPCGGTGEVPNRTRVTPRDLGTRFGGKRMGECPVEGCDVRVNPNGKLAKHEVRPGAFAKAWAAHLNEPAERWDYQLD